MEYTKVSDKETRMVQTLVIIYNSHQDLTTVEKVRILEALGIGEIGIGQILAGDATLDASGCVNVADYARGRH